MLWETPPFPSCFCRLLYKRKRGGGEEEEDEEERREEKRRRRGEKRKPSEWGLLRGTGF